MTKYWTVPRRHNPLRRENDGRRSGIAAAFVPALELNNLKDDCFYMKRLTLQLTAAALAVALAVGGYLAFTQSRSSQQNLCVKAGEPLYPTTQLIQLSNFTRDWGSKYTISVNSTSHTVLVTGPNGVGAINLKSVIFELLSC